MSRAAVIRQFLKRKLATTLLVGASLAAFATLGDGGKKSKTARPNVLALRSNTYNYKTFSLKSGYTFRGNSFLNADGKEHFVVLNTTMKFQKGNATYILPLKKKLFLDKVTFKPTAPQR